MGVLSFRGTSMALLEKWAKKNPVKFNKGKYQVWHLRKNNLMPQHSLGAEWLESRLVEKGTAVLVYKLTVGQQCSLEGLTASMVSFRRC